MRKPNQRIQLERDYLTQWFEHPITKLIMDSLQESQAKENQDFISKCYFTQEQYVIERNLYRIAGKNELVKKLTDIDRVRDEILRDYVEWNKL